MSYETVSCLRIKFDPSFRRSIQSIVMFVEIKKFTMHMKAMFYVKVKFSHSFHFETNQTKTIKEVTTSIGNEIRSRTDKIFAIFDVLSFATTFFLFFVILKYDNIIVLFRRRILYGNLRTYSVRVFPECCIIVTNG